MCRFVKLLSNTINYIFSFFNQFLVTFLTYFDINYHQLSNSSIHNYELNPKDYYCSSEIIEVNASIAILFGSLLNPLQYFLTFYILHPKFLFI